jgi:hypothetical protein
MRNGNLLFDDIDTLLPDLLNVPTNTPYPEGNRGKIIGFSAKETQFWTARKEKAPGRDHNKAMKAKPAVEGGIDLDTTGMATTIRKEGDGVEMKFDAAMVAQIRKDGIQSLTPVIYKITPIADIGPILGMQVPH